MTDKTTITNVSSEPSRYLIFNKDDKKYVLQPRGTDASETWGEYWKMGSRGRGKLDRALWEKGFSALLNGLSNEYRTQYDNIMGLEKYTDDNYRGLLALKVPYVARVYYSDMLWNSEKMQDNIVGPQTMSGYRYAFDSDTLNKTYTGYEGNLSSLNDPGVLYEFETIFTTENMTGSDDTPPSRKKTRVPVIKGTKRVRSGGATSPSIKKTRVRVRVRVPVKKGTKRVRPGGTTSPSRKKTRIPTKFGAIRQTTKLSAIIVATELATMAQLTNVKNLKHTKVKYTNLKHTKVKHTKVKYTNLKPTKVKGNIHRSLESDSNVRLNISKFFTLKDNPIVLTRSQFIELYSVSNSLRKMVLLLGVFKMVPGRMLWNPDIPRFNQTLSAFEDFKLHRQDNLTRTLPVSTWEDNQHVLYFTGFLELLVYNLREYDIDSMSVEELPGRKSTVLRQLTRKYGTVRMKRYLSEIGTKFPMLKNRTKRYISKI